MVTRYMRILLFFDLPVLKTKQRREYTIFRKNIINEGFLMEQESVYSKLVLNKQSADLVITRIKKFLPSEGLVQVLIVTERQFSTIQPLVGESHKHTAITSIERLVIL